MRTCVRLQGMQDAELASVRALSCDSAAHLHAWARDQHLAACKFLDQRVQGAALPAAAAASREFAAAPCSGRAAGGVQRSGSFPRYASPAESYPRGRGTARQGQGFSGKGQRSHSAEPAMLHAASSLYSDAPEHVEEGETRAGLEAEGWTELGVSVGCGCGVASATLCDSCAAAFESRACESRAPSAPP